MMIKTLAAAAIFISASSAALADEYVNGYTRRDGTYVQPHMRSSPDGNPLNNWSTRGNVNPYTGDVGTRNPSGSRNGYGSPSPSFGSPAFPSYNNPYGTR